MRKQCDCKAGMALSGLGGLLGWAAAEAYV